MRRLILLGLLLFMGFGGLEAYGADWKFVGGVTLLKGEEGISFYDTESIERLPDGNVRVWTKTFTDKAEFNRAEGKKEVIEAAAKKLVVGYRPPYFAIDPKNYTNYDFLVDVIGYEETANDPGLKPRMRILFEINCGEKMIRSLSIILYSKDGTATSTRDGTWDYASPETNAETLCKILCRGKN